jgi:ribosomal protein L37AE/L43A
MSTTTTTAMSPPLMEGLPPVDWDEIVASPQRPETFTCRRCGKEWTARVGARGWNRCPHCGTIYAANSLVRSNPRHLGRAGGVRSCRTGDVEVVANWDVVPPEGGRASQ